MSTATEGKHTPGPWNVEPFDSERIPVDDFEWFSTVYAKTEEGEEFILADLCGVGRGSYAQSQGKANACLIAAAPAMLALIEDYLDGKYTDPVAGLMESFDEDARQVVRLAKGESQ